MDAKNNKRMMIIAVAVVAVLLVSSIIIIGNNDSNDRDTETLNVGVVQAGFNGIPSVGRVKYNTSQEFLFTTNNDSEFIPQLADSYDTTDNKVWTFHLNRDAKWHDGTPFTAKDVEWSLNRGIDFPSADTTFLATGVATNGVRIIDDHTIEVTLNSEDSTFMWNLRMGFRVSPEHIYKNVDNPSTFNEVDSMIGTGPYKYISSDILAGTMTFERNTDYYRGTPAIKNLVFKYYGNTDVALMALKRGDIDTLFERMGIDYYYAANIIKENGLNVESYKSSGVTSLIFNDAKSTFADIDLRNAVKYAINYDQLMNISLGGWGSVGTEGMIPDSVPYYLETPLLAQDIVKAKKLLTDAGYVDVTGDGLVEKPNGTAFKPRMLVNNTDTYIRPAELIKSYLMAVGIDVDVYVNVGNWRQEYLLFEFDMVIGWTAPVGTYGNAGYATTLMDMATGGTPFGQINNAEFTGLLKDVREAVSESEKEAAAHAIQRYYADNVSGIALYYADVIQPYSEAFTGYTFDQFYGVLNYETYFNLRPA